MNTSTIPTQPFGATEHMSTKIIFGAVALKWCSQAEADSTLEMLLRYGINHIDTAPGYGESELRVGPWMRENRKDFFLATKCDKPLYKPAKEQIYRSLERLRVDSVDLLQFHNLTDISFRELVFNEGGALEAMVEAKEEGLAKNLGITGHGLDTAEKHLLSLEQYSFDSVLLPYNCLLMKDQEYSDSFEKLLGYCKEHSIAVQTIKHSAKGLWKGGEKNHVTWYQPLDNPTSVKQAVHWAMAKEYIFLNSTGDLDVLPMVLKAAAEYEGNPPSSEIMEELVASEGMEPIFY